MRHACYEVEPRVFGVADVEIVTRGWPIKVATPALCKIVSLTSEPRTRELPCALTGSNRGYKSVLTVETEDLEEV